MVIKKSELSWINVSDIKKAKSFFIDLLGLKVLEEADEYGWLELSGADGGAILGVAQATPEEEANCGGPKPGCNAIMTFTVENLESVKEILEKKGLVFKSEIIVVPEQVKMILFADPDGNLFQLVEPLKVVCKSSD